VCNLLLGGPRGWMRGPSVQCVARGPRGGIGGSLNGYLFLGARGLERFENHWLRVSTTKATRRSK
jgi:hypothetical protein